MGLLVEIIGGFVTAAVGLGVVGFEVGSSPRLIMIVAILVGAGVSNPIENGLGVACFVGDRDGWEVCSGVSSEVSVSSGMVGESVSLGGAKVTVGSSVSWGMSGGFVGLSVGEGVGCCVCASYF